MSLGATPHDLFRRGGLLERVDPSREYRPEQDRFGQAVGSTLALPRGVLIAECGTGVGKGQAYLGPGLLAGRPFLVAPSTKSLQMQPPAPGGTWRRWPGRSRPSSGASPPGRC